ncbi:MAG: hypothetical protein O2904_00390, partial [bacterium]|nr:hypothetical protein [bacterium]
AKGRTPAERVKERENLSDEVRMQAGLEYMDPIEWDTDEWRRWETAYKKVLSNCLKARKTDGWKEQRDMSDYKASRESFAAECSAYGDMYTTVPVDGFREEISSKSGLTRFHVFHPHSRITDGNKRNVELPKKYQDIVYLMRRSVDPDKNNAYSINVSHVVDSRFKGKVLNHYVETMAERC